MSATACPGNPFSTTWDTDPAFTPDFTAEEIDAALSHPAVASADLILCGHTPGPTLLRTGAAQRAERALVVRSSGHLPGEETRPVVPGHLRADRPRGDRFQGSRAWSIEYKWAAV